MPLPIVRITAMLLVLFTWGSLGTDAVDLYQLGPDSLARHPGVPKGRVEAFDFAESKVFAGTTRGCWLYIPAQYDGAKPAALMVFQDGHAYVSETGQVRVPIVLDNLIASGEMPVTIGLFINPRSPGRRRTSGKRMGKPKQPQVRIRHAEFGLRAIPHRGTHSGCHKKMEPEPDQRSRDARDLRHEQRRHLCVDSGVGTAGLFSKGALPHREFYEHPRG